ncbi:type II secretion system protein M [Aeromonas dhakensis]|uniref:type II secretion system protein M n=1 Tax=Aeromonas dhakensis TaxID=196024 RepID=UPI001116AA94|nr:type II secretion system protein M [Aeromonas dhakensis]MDX7832895.1 MSHA biogenesis protein MshJ [Aeromonas dhakensis]TND58608.1 MSHA biogenesis protein MshJ [Aeromonas dhakensis]TNI17341.1 MSHA biogenesis protein MshJ [Aeromonas dhakensis]WAF67582.1 type II secretion system protein M [Aeromonas dhakensis]HDZ8878414.1 MSHA biogenesis protein MshJ [Aeromonas dhakensis]
MSLKAQWQAWADKLAALSQRERVLIMLTGVVLVGAIATYGWLDAAVVRLEQDRLALSSAQRDLEIMDLENQGKQARLARDPDQNVRTQLAGVDEEIGKLDAALKAQTVDLIQAHEMPEVLEALLSRSANLHMVALTSLAPEPLMAGEQRINLFKHGIRLKLEGGYFDVYQYLKALEALPRHFYWKQFDYQVQEHPKAVVEMEIYTLSTSKEFIRG